MMMTSVNDIQFRLRSTIDTYKKLKVMDAVLEVEDGRKRHKNQTLSDTPSDKDAYGYTATKLDAITQQKKVQFQALQSVLEEIKKNGVVQIETLKQDANLNEVKRTDGNDDGAAAAVNTSKADVVRDFGLGDLITATDITETQKKQLAEAYLTEIKALDKIENDSAKPTFGNTAPVSTNSKAVLKEYGKLKQAYIEAVKKGLKDKTIELTDNDLDKATYFNEEPNKKFDPNYKTYTGGVTNGIPDAENVRKTKELAEMKAKLDDIRKRFKAGGIDNVDELLDANEFKPSEDKDLMSKSLGELTPEQKSKIVGSSQTAPAEATWQPIAKKVYNLLEEQKKDNGGKVTYGLTLDNFTTKILGDNTVNTNLEQVYTQSSATPLPQLLGEVSTSTEDVANRETALKEIKPIIVTTNRDRGKVSGGVITVNKNPISTFFPDNQTPLTKGSDSGTLSLLQSEFRGQPAVFSKGADGRVYMQFYNRPNIKNGTGYILSTAMVEVDPKLVFEADGKTPKPEIDVSMLKPDDKGRKVIDYYIRGFKEDGTTNGTVYYVARNFADNIDRKGAIRRAESLATIDVDPVNYKSGEQLATEAAAKKAEEKARNNPITLSLENPTPAVVNPASTQVVQVQRS